MPSSTPLPNDRWAIGQLLVRLLREFRTELFEPAAVHGYPDLREPHLHVFGNLGVDGIRLTDLAARTQLSMGTVSELINELEGLGYVERRTDAKDRRAKLIYPTARGRKLFDDAGERVAEIEARWARIVGKRRFSDACYVLQDLLDALDPDSSAKQFR